MKKRKAVEFVLLASSVVLLFLLLIASNAHPIYAVGPTTIAESNDFAARALGVPWDMSQFSEISQYLNQSGQVTYLQNIQVQNGIFSARSTSNGSQFFTLFPGYLGAMQIGKVGARYPIAASTYHCLNLAMNVQSTGTDYALVFWFMDNRLNGSGGAWGETYPVYTTPSIWKLYTVDLANYSLLTGTAWNSSPTGQWQGLRIDPTSQANVNFAVDWVRLTDCKPVNTTITWIPNSGVNAIWLTSASTGNNILVATGINGSAGSYTLDTQGVAAGTYTVGLGTATSCCAITANTIVINQAPIATFNRPSPYSGTDYATQAGNAWDFKDASDLASFTPQIVILSVANGLLNITTPTGSLPNGADPRFYLNAPQQITTPGIYLYLSYRIYTQYPIQNVPNGMINRWIWGVGATGPATGCEMVSHDIPFDVGWQIYSIDLSDPYNQGVVQTAGSCPLGPYSWMTSAPIGSFRFKPNENALGQTLFQQLDWVRLTQVDSVNHGTAFPITISLNKPPQGTTFNFYYTTNLQQPTQNLATAVHVPPPSGPFHTYLPLIQNANATTDLPPVVNGVTFNWDTTSVSPGTYYACVVANDGYNQTTFCSEAPVIIH